MLTILFRFENDREKNQQVFLDYTEKSYKTTRELEKLSDEHTRVLNELDDLRNKLRAVQAEKDELQKELTKRVGFRVFLVW
jgi:hypothetical protein